MKLYYTKRSPYACKVRAVAHAKGVHDQIEEIEVDLKNKPAELTDANPLAKIPCLVLADGEAIYDSPVICEAIDALCDGPDLRPIEGKARILDLRLEALADGASDALVAAVMEGFRETHRSENYIQFQMSKLEDALGALNDMTADIGGAGVTIGTLAVATALGYVDLRGEETNWQDTHTALANWYLNIADHPSVDYALPRL